MECRILKCGKCKITQGYIKTLKYKHLANDIVALKNGKVATDYVLAHSDGEVVLVVKNYNRNDKTGDSYGNFVKIKHSNNYYTLYAHLKYGSVTVSKGDKVKKGQIIGYMGNTGRSDGAHTHFEVWKGSSRINPTSYLNADLPTKKTISYRTHHGGKWQGTKTNGQQSGNGLRFVSGYQVKSNVGTVYYRSHTLDTKKWEAEVSKWDNTVNGYAGIIGKKSDGFMVKTTVPIKYRVKTKKSGWLPWVTGYNTKDSRNGYAGNFGEEITALEIKFV